MTLFFNLKTLEEQSGSDPNKFMAMLEYHYTKKIPRLYARYKPSKVSLHGHSFILNPSPLFATSVDLLYVIQYIKLAALRDYALYKLYSYKGLQVSYFPDINLQTIQYNPLLNITKTEIFFKFEDNK